MDGALGRITSSVAPPSSPRSLPPDLRRLFPHFPTYAWRFVRKVPGARKKLQPRIILVTPPFLLQATHGGLITRVLLLRELER
eukprot:gene958-1094_t